MPTPRHGRALLAALLASALAAASAQPSQPGVYDDYMSGQVHVSKAMIALLAAVVAVFVFIAFFTVYLRHCSGGYALRRDDDRGAAPNFDAFISRSRRQRRPRGLDAEVVEAFPTMKYAEARALRVGKGGALECAVCLSEFEDEERLRLLPKCSHAFHPECIGEWLASHVTYQWLSIPVASSISSETAVARMGDGPLPVAVVIGYSNGGGGGRGAEAGGAGAAADRDPAATGEPCGRGRGADAARPVALHGPLPRPPARPRPGAVHAAAAGARAQGDCRRRRAQRNCDAGEELGEKQPRRPHRRSAPLGRARADGNSFLRGPSPGSSRSFRRPG